MNNTAEKCPIWGTEAERIPISNRSQKSMYDSPRAGGKYRITNVDVQYLRELSDGNKARLTDWLIEQRQFGNETPEITVEEIDQAKKTRPLSIIERTNRLLGYYARKSTIPGSPIYWKSNEIDYNVLLANCGSSLLFKSNSGQPNPGKSDLKFLFGYLESKGFIQYDQRTKIPWDVIVTVEGYAHLESLQSKQIESTQVFVAMWLDPSMEEAYEEGIKPAIEDAGYTSARIGRKEHNNRIDDEIISEIHRSRFLVADFSQGKDGARGGVYYEAGFAQGLGIPVIFTCRKEDEKIIHFNTRQINHIFWKTPEDMRDRLLNRITATIGDGPHRVA